ncbi:MAG: FHA domain-containing protein [Candidatus Binataceae bacterium]
MRFPDTLTLAGFIEDCFSMSSHRRFMVGRANTCDIPIADDSVSRAHAEIDLLDGDRLLIHDLGSQNGTTLIRQGREFRIGEETVLIGDLVRFGEVTLTVKDVIDALRAAAAREAAARPAPAANRPAVPRPAAGSGSLVRCGCGAVKARNERCPVCGE